MECSSNSAPTAQAAAYACRPKGASTPSVQYGRDKVDVSGTGGTVAERFIEASKELAGINSHLGMTDYGLLCRVICEGRRLEHEALPVGGREPERYIARRIKDALGDLASYWGAKGRSHASIRADCTGAKSLGL